MNLKRLATLAEEREDFVGDNDMVVEEEEEAWLVDPYARIERAGELIEEVNQNIEIEIEDANYSSEKRSRQTSEGDIDEDTEAESQELPLESSALLLRDTRNDPTLSAAIYSPPNIRRTRRRSYSPSSNTPNGSPGASQSQISQSLTTPRKKSKIPNITSYEEFWEKVVSPTKSQPSTSTSSSQVQQQGQSQSSQSTASQILHQLLPSPNLSLLLSPGKTSRTSALTNALDHHSHLLLQQQQHQQHSSVTATSSSSVLLPPMTSSSTASSQTSSQTSTSSTISASSHLHPISTSFPAPHQSNPHNTNSRKGKGKGKPLSRDLENPNTVSFSALPPPPPLLFLGVDLLLSPSNSRTGGSGGNGVRRLREVSDDNSKGGGIEEEEEGDGWIDPEDSKDDRLGDLDGGGSDRSEGIDDEIYENLGKGGDNGDGEEEEEEEEIESGSSGDETLRIKRRSRAEDVRLERERERREIYTFRASQEEELSLETLEGTEFG